jgi:hypothetical protein
LSSRQRRKRRRRARSTTAPAVPPRTTPAAPPERPQTPWHPFPLVELAIFVGLVCIVVGFLTRDGARGRVLLALGMTLASLGGLDTAVREHFAGYRSHALVLAAFPAVATTVILALAGVPPVLVPGAGILVFVAALLALRRAWHRTGDRTPA